MRPDWDAYFLDIAHAVAKRSTCTRKQVGCVITRDHHILSTGYGGSRPGEPHCTDVGCEMRGGGCKRTIHAEQNALRMVRDARGATAYVTLSPCPDCYAYLRMAGVARIVFSEKYRLADHLQPEDGLELVWHWKESA